MKFSLRTVLLATTALGFIGTSPAHAAASTNDAIKALQAQVTALQKQLTELQAKEETRAVAESTKAAAPTEGAKEAKKEILPGVSVKLGGFVAMEGIYRDSSQGTDAATSVAGIKYGNDAKAHSDEFRASARSTRLSLLAEGKPDADTKLSAYVEADFLGASPSANPSQSNSYMPRLRQAYAQVDRSDWGFHFTAGQAFSLLTLNKSGLLPNQLVGMQTIDTMGGPGYAYTRSPQVRFVKEFADKKLNVGLSLESPGAMFGEITLPTSNVVNYESKLTDVAPDVIAKVGYDASIGHFEAFGITRFFHDTLTATGKNNYAMGYGGGAGAYVPLLSKKLELQANFLAGKGLGRYSAGLMPDLAFTPTYNIKPVGMMSAQFGVVAHPTPTWDLYTYVGGEKALREAQSGGGTSFGYGNFTANNSGCSTVGGTCQAQTETVWSVTPGLWKQVYKGDYGAMKVGAQYQFVRKDAFTGLNDKAAHTDANVVMMSFRYSPF